MKRVLILGVIGPAYRRRYRMLAIFLLPRILHRQRNRFDFARTCQQARTAGAVEIVGCDRIPGLGRTVEWHRRSFVPAAARWRAPRERIPGFANSSDFGSESTEGDRTHAG